MKHLMEVNIMQLDTKHFGAIEVEESGIINFPEGIPGFEDIKRFVLLGNEEKNSPFQWLQGVDNPTLAFVIIEPKVFKPEYEVDVHHGDVDLLGITDANEVLVYCIVVVPEDTTRISANLKAPILINTVNNKAKQVILENNDYKTKHYILEELQKNGGKK